MAAESAVEPGEVVDVNARARETLLRLMGWHDIDEIGVAKLLGVHRNSVRARLGKAPGSKRFSLDEIMLLAGAFGVPETWFTRGPDGVPPALPPTSSLVRRQGLEPRTRCFGGQVLAALVIGGRPANDGPRTRQMPLLHLVRETEAPAAQAS